MNESFITDLLKKFVPGLQKKSEEKYLKSHERTLQKYEKKIQQAEDKANAAVKEFEKAFEKRTGKKLNLDDYSLADIIAGKHK